MFSAIYGLFLGYHFGCVLLGALGPAIVGSGNAVLFQEWFVDV